MKKLNKLLMPVVGLSTIAATAIPLAACNKYIDGVEVTTDEWNNALAYLSATVEGATWKMSADDSMEITQYDDGIIKQYIKFYNVAFNDEFGSMDGLVKEGKSGEIEKVKMVSIANSNMYFTYEKEDSETTWGKAYVDQYSLLEEYLIYMIDSIGGQDEFEYNKDTKSYIYNGDFTYEGSKAHADITVRFDSNKKITFMNYHTTVFDDANPSVVFGLTLHPQYKGVKVEVPEELKTRVAANVFEMTSKTQDFTLPSSLEDSVIVNFTSNGSYQTLNVKDKRSTGAFPAVHAIYLNNNLLESGTDYTYEINTGKVTFTKKTIAKNDKLNISIGSFIDSSKVLTVTFA